MSWKDFLREGLLETQAYEVPLPDGRIKLDAMENPYTWPSDMREDWLQELEKIDVNRYPDASARDLKQQLRDTYEIDPDYDLLIGNGSDELIQIVCAAFASEGATVLSVDPAFVVYRSAASLYGLSFETVPLNDDFEIDVAAMLAAIEKFQPAVIFLAYPNNPTGNLFDAGALRQIIEAAPGLVVVDEAYQPFARVSWLEEGLADHVVVMRTLSKFGLAGLRLGYMIGQRAVISELNKLRMPYNVNTLSMETACFALRHHTVFDEQADHILQERSRMQQAFGRFESLDVFASDANFILVRASGVGEQLFDHLLQSGIRVKNLTASGGALTDCLRVTIGKPDQNDSLLAALDNFYQ
jgi:histidinol-phosphate aminotransferase